MPVVRMPDGTDVSFPDDMPPERIRNLIATKFPDAPAQIEQPPAEAAPQPVEAAPQNNQFQLGLQSTGRGIADVAGFPVDLTTLVLNSGLAATDLLAEQFGGNVDTRIEKPFLGSDFIAEQTGDAFELLGGDLIEKEEMTPGERLKYEANRFASGAGAGAVTAARTAGLRAAEEAPVVGETIRQLGQRYFGQQGVAKPLAGDVAAGAGAGTGSFAFEEYVPDWIKFHPILGPAIHTAMTAAGGIGGGSGAAGIEATGRAGVRGAQRATGRHVDREVPRNEATGERFSKTDVETTARIAQETASNPRQAAQNIESATTPVPLDEQGNPIDPTQFNLRQAAQDNALPPTGSLSRDAGLVAAENAARVSDSVPFIERGQRTNTAAREQVDTLAPPGADARAFTGRAEEVAGAREQAAQRGVERVQGEQEALGLARAREGAVVAQNRGGKPAASEAVDEAVVEGTLGPMQEQSARLYGQVDPGRTATVETDPLLDAAAKVRATLGDFNTPSKVIPESLLRRIEATEGEPPSDGTPATTRERPTGLLDADGNPITRAVEVPGTEGDPGSPSETSIGDLTEALPEISQTIERARRAGNITLVDNLRALRAEMKGMIDDAADAGDEAARIPELRTDNPGGEWLKHQIEVAEDNMRTASPGSYRSKVSGAVTGYFAENLALDPKKIAEVPGAQGEEAFRGSGPKMDNLQRAIGEEGYQESPIFIAVNHRGEPFIMEGNTRLAEAIASGRPRIKAEVRYFAGGEAVDGPFAPDKLQSLGPTAPASSSAAQRFREAETNYAETIGPTFNRGPGDEATRFRKDFNQDRFNRSTTPPSQTAGRFLRPGQKERAESLNRILEKSGNAEAGRAGVRDFLMADMAESGVLDASGAIRPDALRKWRDQKWGDVLDAAPHFRDEVNTLLSRAQRGERLKGEFATQLRQAERGVDAAKKANSALELAIGKSPTNAVKAIFSSGDPETAVDDILRDIGGNRAAKDGLKTAIRDHLVEDKTTSAVHNTTDGSNPVSFDRLDKLFKRHEKVLAKVYSPEEMNALRGAHSLLKTGKQRELQATTGSATAERSAQTWRWLEIGLKAKFGILKGGGILRTMRLWADTLPSDREAVAQIQRQMWFDPELAQHLLRKPLKDIDTPAWNGKLNRLLALGAGARDVNDGDE